MLLEERVNSRAYSGRSKEPVRLCVGRGTAQAGKFRAGPPTWALVDPLTMGLRSPGGQAVRSRGILPLPSLLSARLCVTARRSLRPRIAAANNIRTRLGGEPGTASVFPPRPKGMHRETYERLQSAVLNAEILAEERLAILLARLQRGDRRTERRSAGRSRKEFWK
jgi:hypothetical protein